MWPPPGPTIPALPQLAAALGTTGNERGLNYGNYRNTRVFSQGLKNLTATVGLVKIHWAKASIVYPQCLCKWIHIIDPWFATGNTVNYSQRLGWGRGWLACFFIQHLWPQSLYFSVVKFFSFLFYVKPTCHNYTNANNIKNKICCTNFEHKSSWKLKIVMFSIYQA